jgi:hypothetical protein
MTQKEFLELLDKYSRAIRRLDEPIEHLWKLKWQIRQAVKKQFKEVPI